MGATYWSIMPSVAPTRRAPWIRWWWSNASDPDNQGMRRGRSRRIENSGSTLKLRIGRAWRDISTVPSIGAFSPVLPVFDVVVERKGREYAAEKPTMTNLMARNVK